MEKEKSKTKSKKTNSEKNTKLNRNKLLFILVVIIVIIIIAVVLVKNNDSKENTDQNEISGETQFYREEEGTKINTSNKLAETKEIEGLEITNANLSEYENNSTFIATLTNKTNTASGEYYLDLKFVDKDNNEIATISCYVDKVEPGQSIELNAAATASLADAYDYIVTRQ